MLKKISLAIIASAMLLVANTENFKDIDCDEQFESCIVKCDNSNNENCIEKCEQLLDKCLFEQEANPDSDSESNEDFEKDNK